MYLTCSTVAEPIDRIDCSNDVFSFFVGSLSRRLGLPIDLKASANGIPWMGAIVKPILDHENGAMFFYVGEKLVGECTGWMP